MEKAIICGVGMAVPENEVTNEALCEMFPALATSDEWLMKNVGVRKRYLADEYQSLSDLLVKAGTEALEQAGVRKVDRIIVGSNSQSRHYPATASEVAQRLAATWDLSSCWCLDIQNGCPSGLAAIGLAVDAVKTGQARVVLAMGGDVTSRMVDWFDRNTCLLMGDGASAVVVACEEEAEGGGVKVDVLSHWEQTDFDSAEIMHMVSAMGDFSPFEISRRTRDAARRLVRRLTGEERIPPGLPKEKVEELQEAADELRRLAFPAFPPLPYREDRYPYFVMAGGEVLEKIRRIVPDCGYLPALREAGIGTDIFEKHGLLEVNKVSDIPAKERKEVLLALAERYDMLIPHQANLRGHQNLSAAFRLPMSKIYSNIADYANTSAAAAGIAFYEALRKPSRYRTIRGNLEEIEVPPLKAGGKAVLVSFGSGTNVVFAVVERRR